MFISGTVETGSSIVATDSAETILPLKSAAQNRCRSAVVLKAPLSPLPRTGGWRLFARSPEPKRYPEAASRGNSSSLRQALLFMPAGVRTKFLTQS